MVCVINEILLRSFSNLCFYEKRCQHIMFGGLVYFSDVKAGWDSCIHLPVCIVT